MKSFVFIFSLILLIALANAKHISCSSNNEICIDSAILTDKTVPTEVTFNITILANVNWAAFGINKLGSTGMKNLEIFLFTKSLINGFKLSLLYSADHETPQTVGSSALSFPSVPSEITYTLLKITTDSVGNVFHHISVNRPLKFTLPFLMGYSISAGLTSVQFQDLSDGKARSSAWAFGMGEFGYHENNRME
ncbi:hypothetical protein HK096_004600, partial [Nowakowskiella sp. JEL0078]